MTDPSYVGPSLCLHDNRLACDGSKWPPGFNTSTTSRPKLGDIVYGTKLITCNVNGTLALTYDDGPSRWTHDLLDILKANDVKATFFITAVVLYEDLTRHRSDQRPSAVKRIYNEGHQVAGHTWSHPDLNSMLDWQRRGDMTKMEMALTDILGFSPTYMRPPYNKCDRACQDHMGELGYHVVSLQVEAVDYALCWLVLTSSKIGWDIDPKDWKGNYTYAEQNFLRRIQAPNHEDKKARLNLAHDTYNGTVHGLTQFMIDNARKHGYKFVTVGECLGDPEENWYRDPLTGNKLGRLLPKGTV